MTSKTNKIATAGLPHTTSPQPALAKAPRRRAAAPTGDHPIPPLLARAQAGDPDAVDGLLAGMRPRALAVALRVLHNSDDAEDAVQEAFVKAWRYLPRFEGRSSFSTWLFRVVTNASLDRLRSRSCRPEVCDDDCEGQTVASSEPRDDNTPERRWNERETAEIVRAAMARLTPSHRRALELREFEEQSYEEIAQASGCPVGTVMSRLHHARRKLADELQHTDLLAA